MFVTWLLLMWVATRFTFGLYVNCVWIVHLFVWLVVGCGSVLVWVYCFTVIVLLVSF